MRIYKLGSQLVPLEELAYAAVETGGECEMTMVVDEEGSLPPADARLVDVDEAREALIRLLEAEVRGAQAFTPRTTQRVELVILSLRRAVYALFPEGE